MANPAKIRTAVAWALLKHPGALSSGHSRLPAIAASETVKMFIDTVDGEKVISVEDPSLPTPGLIPWGNIASLGLLP